MTTPPARTGFLRGVFEGVGLLARGFKVWITSPRAMWLGLIPSLITFAVFTAAVIVLVLNIDALSLWLTGFASAWDEGWRLGLRIAVGAAVLGVAGLLLAYTFAVVTLAIGQPFFEAISRRVDDSFGGVTEAEQKFWPSLLRGIAEAIGVIALTVLVGLGLLLLGFVPLVGSIIAAVIGAFTGAWFLALELTTVPFERRGLRLGRRWKLLAGQRSVSLGFGLAVFLLFLVPFGALVAMPSAVAGATLLARRALGEDISATRAATSAA